MNLDDHIGPLLRDVARDVYPVSFGHRVRRGIRRRRIVRTAAALAVTGMIAAGGLVALRDEAAPARSQLVRPMPPGGLPVLSYQLLGGGKRASVKDPLRSGYLQVPYRQAQVSPDGRSAAVFDEKGPNRVGVIDLEHPRRQPRWFELPPSFDLDDSATTMPLALQWAPDSRQLFVNSLVNDGYGASRGECALIRLDDGAVTVCGDSVAYAAARSFDGQPLYTATASRDGNDAALTSLITFYDLYGRVVRQFVAPGQIGGVLNPTASPLSPDQHSLLGQRMTGSHPDAREFSYRWELIEVDTGRAADLPFSVRYSYDASRDIFARNGREPIGWYDTRHLVVIEGSGSRQRLAVYDLRGTRTRVLSLIPDNVVLQLGLPGR